MSKGRYEDVVDDFGMMNVFKFNDLMHIQRKDIWDEIGRACKLSKEKTIKELTEDLDYWDNQPATSEFAKGFEHCCEVIKKRITLDSSRASVKENENDE